MKTNLFRKNHPFSRVRIMRLALLLLPLLGRGLGGGCVLFAQNGVTVSGLAVDAGTVTFNVSWKNTGMPSLWSDTVWVFVDYNKNGVMERLPLLPGATLTATSAEDVGKVKEEPGNNQGVWVVGNARTNSSFSATVKLLTAIKDVGGACVYGSNYPPVGEYNISVDKVSVSFTGTPPYDLVVNTGNGTTSVQAYSTYNLFAGQTVQSFTDKTGAPGIIIPGYNQPQGSCTFTRPLVVGTFAAFPSNYSASTYVTLTDERDNKNYEVVKIGGRWVMARNLNYQKGLTWRANSASPSTVSGQNTTLIGNFWCPGGYSSTTTISTRESCDVWGALYSWETAMMLDGYGTWTEVNMYNTGAANAAGSQFNHGRTAHSGTGTSGRGICPQNWHVPTDNEWGIILDGMESGGGTAHQSASSNSWYGTDAGTRAKSKCMCPSADYCDTDTDVPRWCGGGVQGTDSYGFCVLPAGLRSAEGSTISGRCTRTYFWSSSAYNRDNAWTRHLVASYAQVYRAVTLRSLGFSVRCIRN